MFEHILIAVDGSDHSQRAVEAGAQVAKKFGADVFVLHVREREMGRAGTFPMETPDDANLLLGEAMKVVKQAGVSASSEVQSAVIGHAAKHIVETAKTKGVDLIVMGSRGLSDLAGLLLGSVTHKVIQLAHVPVLVIRAPDSGTTKVGAGSASEAQHH